MLESENVKDDRNVEIDNIYCYCFPAIKTELERKILN